MFGPQGSTVSSYLYNGDNALAQETNGATTTNYWLDSTGGLPERLGAKTGSITIWYGRGWGQEVQRQQMNSQLGISPSWYLADRMGSIRGLVNSGGSLTASYNYDPLGTPEGTAPLDYGFAGEPQNTSLGLVQLRARWYGTKQGAFTSRDPLAARMGDPFSVDAYLYGNDDPVDNTDATGLRLDNDTRETYAVGGEPIDALGSAMPGDRVPPVILAINPLYPVTGHIGALQLGGTYIIRSPTQSWLWHERIQQTAAWKHFVECAWNGCGQQNLDYVPIQIMLEAMGAPDNPLAALGAIGGDAEDAARLLSCSTAAEAADAATTGAQVSRTIRLLGFRGAGESRGYSGLIALGHVGISFDEGRTIYGFHPTPEAAALPNLRELINQDPGVAGQVYNDTDVFENAHNLPTLPDDRGVVFQQDIPVTEQEYERIHNLVLAQVNDPSLTTLKYRLPVGPKGSGALHPPGCANCATWPRELGLTIPEPTGWLESYIMAIKAGGQGWRWTPSK